MRHRHEYGAVRSQAASSGLAQDAALAPVGATRGHPAELLTERKTTVKFDDFSGELQRVRHGQRGAADGSQVAQKAGGAEVKEESAQRFRAAVLPGQVQGQDR